ncbi:crotonase [Sulfodiicoccus acidiphilus]|uniref:Crotonase n=1 Tax=Sulfodiicoccus acidiphilus TaxID=1670455 RepID=A0A348B1H4_9CREN|nr:enoyl-CoA hydratase/isomerase family protein [Sulfodiicoccus acidiphilus]BBD72026.1 crotonase [Sulfodiicoccus acidiphilus]GGU00310.1 crotonase [Sulfodiicoccus acidiphilus]
MSQTVLSEKRGNTLVLILNRPETLNAMNLEMRRALLGLLRDAEANPEIRAVIITGAGKAFSAGADVNYLLSLDETNVREYVTFVHSLLDYVESYPKLTIGAVNGVAVGGGLELLLTLDLVVASSEAKFGQTELNLGLIPGGGGTQRLPRLVGLRKAKEMIFTGGLIDADEALRLGLVNKVVPRDRLMEESLLLAGKVAEKDVKSLAAAKASLNNWGKMTIQDGLKYEASQYAQTLLRPEVKGKLAEFLHRK